MNLLLAALFGCLVIGLVAPRLSHRAQLAIAGIGVLTTALYFVFPLRFM